MEEVLSAVHAHNLHLDDYVNVGTDDYYLAASHLLQDNMKQLEV